MSGIISRGLPSTSGIQDPAVRRFCEGVAENLRRAGVILEETTSVVSRVGAKFSGTLVNMGTGTPVGVGFSGSTLTLRKIIGGTNVTVDVDADGNVVIGAESGAAGSDRKVGVDSSDASPSELSDKLVQSATEGEALLSYDASRGTILGIKGGTGILVSSGALDVEVEIDPEYAFDDHLVLAEGTDDTPGYLGSKVTSVAAGAAVLVLDAAAHLLKVKGIAGGTGIAAGAGATDVTVALDISGIATEAFNKATQTFLAWNGAAQKRVALGAAAGADFGTGASDAAAGNHTHAFPPSGSAENDILCWTTAAGGSWVVRSFSSVLATALTALGTVTPTISDKVFVKMAAGSLGWGPIKQCS